MKATTARLPCLERAGGAVAADRSDHPTPPPLSLSLSAFSQPATEEEATSGAEEGTGQDRTSGDEKGSSRRGHKADSQAIDTKRLSAEKKRKKKKVGIPLLQANFAASVFFSSFRRLFGLKTVSAATFALHTFGAIVRRKGPSANEA
jgi:hypothetical protein